MKLLRFILLSYCLFILPLSAAAEDVLPVNINTADAVTTGIFTSIQGAVNLVCRKLPSSLPILLTGGDANLIYKQSEEDWKSRIKLEDDLIFEGLMFY